MAPNRLRTEIAGAKRLQDRSFSLDRPCPLFDVEKPSERLLYTRVGEHYLVHVESVDEIVMDDFVHVQSRNLPAVVAALEAGELEQCERVSTTENKES